MFRSATWKASFIRSNWLHPPSIRARLSSIHRRPYWSQSRQLILRQKLSSRIFRRKHSQRTPNNSHTNPTPNLNSPEPRSFTARLKKLSREYGYTVIGIYLAITVADLPFCFLAVKYIGAERVAYAEHVIFGGIKDMIGRVLPDLFEKTPKHEAKIEAAKVEEEEESGEPTMWTKLGLVFLVHKSFIFIRVPLTAAITPKVVKTLRGWGYNIGKTTPKAKQTSRTPRAL